LRLRLRVQVEATQSLLRLTERLKRDALLSDFGGRVAAWEASSAEAAARRADALHAVRARADAAAARLAATSASAAPRVALTQAGDETLLDDLDAPLDDVTARLYEIATTMQ
jgi:hypothetical protein